MNDEELKSKIERFCEGYKGQIPELYQMVGIVTVGRLFGWRVVRLTASRHMWGRILNEFGDPKEWMPEEGPLAYKSVGLGIIKKLGDYWGFISGSKSREGLSAEDRKMLI